VKEGVSFLRLRFGGKFILGQAKSVLNKRGDKLIDHSDRLHEILARDQGIKWAWNEVNKGGYEWEGTTNPARAMMLCILWASENASANSCSWISKLSTLRPSKKCVAASNV
jgi:hypothetical protein